MTLPDADKWREATYNEIQYLVENKTWDLDDMLSGRKLIRTKLVFKRNYKSDGFLDKYKARLVCTSYSQKYGIDYKETYSPVFRPKSTWLLIAIAVQLDAGTYQMNVTTAFLNGRLEEKSHVKQPYEGVKKGAEDKVYKLRKSFCGLKKAPLLEEKNS